MVPDYYELAFPWSLVWLVRWLERSQVTWIVTPSCDQGPMTTWPPPSFQLSQSCESLWLGHSLIIWLDMTDDDSAQVIHDSLWLVTVMYINTCYKVIRTSVIKLLLFNPSSTTCAPSIRLWISESATLRQRWDDQWQSFITLYLSLKLSHLATLSCLSQWWIEGSTLHVPSLSLVSPPILTSAQLVFQETAYPIRGCNFCGN
jgi:hypothetical protein